MVFDVWCFIVGFFGVDLLENWTEDCASSLRFGLVVGVGLQLRLRNSFSPDKEIILLFCLIICIVNSLCTGAIVELTGLPLLGIRAEASVGPEPDVRVHIHRFSKGVDVEALESES
jgi:hypothetical protein